MPAMALEEVHDHYVELYEFAPISYLTLSHSGMIAETNRAGARLFGISRKKLIHRCFAVFVADHDKVRWQRLFLSMIEGAGSETRCFDVMLVRGDGARINVYCICHRSTSDTSSPLLRIAMVDITQLKQAEANLRIAASAFQTQECIFITDANAVILKVNQAFTTLTGYGAEEVVGQTPRLFNSGRHDATFYAAMWESIRNAGSWAGKIWNRRKTGEIKLDWLSITAVRVGNEKGVSHYVAILTDSAIQDATSEQIEHMAFYDPLTNLPNRRLLWDRLRHAVASSARNKRHGALLFIDLDNFKTLNDTLGHDIGDLLLQQVAQRLGRCIREGDTAARLGGDEFVVMLEDLSEQLEEAGSQAEFVGKKILAALNQPYGLATYDYRCTPSIGATLFYDHSVKEDELLKRADIAMYQAKHKGRNGICFFDQAMQLALSARTALATELHIALEQNQFRLHYQMQMCRDNQVIGAEVLLRWQHPQRGLIAARDFIQLAEDTGLILPIGQWVLENACAQLKMWEANPRTKRLQLAVNVSARQFHQADFVDQVSSVLQKTRIEPNRLKLELAEHVASENIDDTLAKTQALSTIGVCITLDGFGTGKLSLAYLVKLPLAQLKIAQSFVQNIGEKAADALIVKTLINMARHLGISVMTEGVETEAQRAFLELNGCFLCQGYLFGMPAPIEVFEQCLGSA
ncbi:MAG: EAL domain-containing protein [Methylococcaceae bacterium]|nr:EAL domain-containing protein [Methylococcaceae bacterium]